MVFLCDINFICLTSFSGLFDLQCPELQLYIYLSNRKGRNLI